MDPHELVPFDYQTAFKQKHAEYSKTLNRSICLPSSIQAYNMANQFIKQWFLSKFNPGTFKTVYLDGKNVMDEFRRVSKLELIKRPKPSVAIYPSIDWAFNDEGIDMYQYGLDTYSMRGLYKDSFFKDSELNMYLGLSMQVLLVNFSIRCRVETKPQQMDMYKFIQIAHRVGNMYGDDIDLDFHVPYALMVQMAEDAGFEVEYFPDKKRYPAIKNIHGFLSYLNTHSAIPFLYKFRAENGHNEFFIRMQRMYVNINPSELSADDGEMEGHIKNNFGVELNVELRFPAPQFYGYYSSNEHKIKTVYGTWNQATGVITSIYSFKGLNVPPKNKYGWELWADTTYEANDCVNNKLVIDFREFFNGDLKEYINICLYQGISPSIFCDMILINNGRIIVGDMDWKNLTFISTNPVESPGTYIGVYLDNEYMNNYILCKTNAVTERMQHTASSETDYNREIIDYHEGKK